MTLDREKKDYDSARVAYRAAIKAILLFPGTSKTATLLALVDCVAGICAGAVHFGSITEEAIVARFVVQLSQAVKAAKREMGGDH